MKTDTKPATPSVALILLVLAGRPRHGYGIRNEIERLTGGETAMGSGTFYRSIQRMLMNGWVRRLDHLADSGNEDDERRIYYELTPHGREAAAAEARRLADLVAVAISRRLLPGYRLERPAHDKQADRQNTEGKR